MTLVFLSATSSVMRCAGIQSIPVTNNHHRRYAVFFRNSTMENSASMKIFSTYRTWSTVQPVPRVPVVAINDDEVAFQETVYTPDAHVKPNVQSKGRRPPRKSVMPPVKNEDLVQGAAFTGKVRSIQPFGAFVDIGAFTEGLVHISNLSDTFVTDVKTVVSVGQEVKVRIVEANFEIGRISLTMRESNDSGDLQQQEDSSSSKNGTKPAPSKRNTTKSKQKSTKLVKGQELDGTVRKIIRAGSFISLPEEEEGFLPISEESVDAAANITGGSSLQVGQEVHVRVLHVTKGHVTLTMKKEVDVERLNPEVIHVGVVHEGTKPFVYAFRRCLDKREEVL